MSEIRALIGAVLYFDKHVGHFTDYQKIDKLLEEVHELEFAIHNPDKGDIIDECADVLAIAFHIAKRNGFKGTADDLVLQAYCKMRTRIESGERDYINRDF